MDLILIIVIISVIVKNFSKYSDDSGSGKQIGAKMRRRSKRSSGDTYNTQWQTSSQTAYSTNQQQTVHAEQAERWKKAARENIEKAKVRARKKVEELKRELEIEDDSNITYGMPKQAEDKSPVLKKSDMKKQKVSAMEQIYANRKEAHTTSILEQANVAEDILSDNLLLSVEDLIVKGYDGNLCFERDFVGEALDMISRFTVPSEVPDFAEDHDDVA